MLAERLRTADVAARRKRRKNSIYFNAVYRCRTLLIDAKAVQLRRPRVSPRGEDQEDEEGDGELQLERGHPGGGDVAICFLSCA